MNYSPATVRSIATAPVVGGTAVGGAGTAEQALEQAIQAGRIERAARNIQQAKQMFRDTFAISPGLLGDVN